MKQKPYMNGREKRRKTKAKYEGEGKNGMKQNPYMTVEKNGMKQKPCIKGREKRHETKAMYKGKGKTA